MVELNNQTLGLKTIIRIHNKMQMQHEIQILNSKVHMAH